jgi:hypothetical protein
MPALYHIKGNVGFCHLKFTGQGGTKCGSELIHIRYRARIVIRLRLRSFDRISVHRY